MCLEEDKDYTIEWKSSIKSFITDHGWSPKRRLEFRGEVVPTLQLSLRCIVPFCSPFSNLQVGFAHVSQDCPQICTAEMVARRGTNTCQSLPTNSCQAWWNKALMSGLPNHLSTTKNLMFVLILGSEVCWFRISEKKESLILYACSFARVTRDLFSRFGVKFVCDCASWGFGDVDDCIVRLWCIWWCSWLRLWWRCPTFPQLRNS